MRLRQPLLLTLVLLAASCRPTGHRMASAPEEASPAITQVDRREYIIEQRLLLRNSGPGQPEKQNLWVALIRDLPPYQEVKSLTIAPSQYTPVSDEYGNRFAEFDFSGQPQGSSKTVVIKTRVVVHELAYEFSDCVGELPEDFVQPELHIESANPQIVRLAGKLVSPTDTPCQKVRAFYDYVANELTYTSNGRSWGAQAALGPMGADCTEYTSLLMALARTQGIPARYYEGLRYIEPELAADERIEHAWPDVFMPGVGWVALDPTLGRSKLTRDAYFAHYTPDHIIVTTGRNPSTLRGSSYWTHLYWPGDATQISVESSEWKIELVRAG